MRVTIDSAEWSLPYNEWGRKMLDILDKLRYLNDKQLSKMIIFIDELDKQQAKEFNKYQENNPKSYQ